MSVHIHLFDGERLTAVDTGAVRPLRWAAWQPDGSWCLLVGNGGGALRYDPSATLRAGSSTTRFEPITTDTKHNLRGVAISPDGRRALLVGNRGAVFLYEEGSVRALSSPTTENLRRVAWRPQGDYAIIVGNGGTVLRYQDGELTHIPGDRAHTLRTVAWRPDGEYALVGAYASRWAGYPRPHALYKCDGRYLQALLTSDEEDDFVAVDWHPEGRQALIVGYAFKGAREASSNKLLTYDGGGFSYRAVEASGALLGAAWHPNGAYALLCGEGGALFRYRPSAEQIEQVASGTQDNLVGPFWRPAAKGQSESLALLLRGPEERVYTV
ncbi:MAG: hypothetical protein IIC26_06395 [Chloroflexi bacterium]|nr:hypothetical protein [Chloroflexota bacterium]